MVSVVGQEEDRVNQRLKRLLQRFAQARLANTFAAWRDEAEFERSVHKLEQLLAPCEDVFDQLPHERTEAGVSAVLQVLQRLPLFSCLCPAAQRCIAVHAKVLVLSDGVEMPTCEDDSHQLYSVLCGSVSLIHGDPSDPHLQQLLLTAQQQVAAEEAAAPALPVRSSACNTLSGGSTSHSSRSVGSSRILRDSSSFFDGALMPSPSKGRNRHGVWHIVKEAVSAGQKRRIHSSMAGQHNSQVPSAVAQNHQPQQQQNDAVAEKGVDDGVKHAAAGVQLDAASLMSGVSVGAAGPGQSFCGSKFAGLIASASAVAAAAAAHSNDDVSHIDTSQLPSSCMAAVAEPNSVAALMVISRPVYTEAMRVHHDAHVYRLVDAACRLPCLRHTPIKELHKLATHMKESIYEPGQVLLRQGREVTDIHFLIQGTVLLTYTQPISALNKARNLQLRVSSGGSAAAPGGNTASSSTAAADVGTAQNAAAANSTIVGGGGSNVGPRASLADVLRVSQQVTQPPVVLGVRGPGAVLGDDAMRERRLAVGVTAATQVVTLRVAPQKFLSALDPLTLRLFGRLRQQQPPAQQRLIQEALGETTDPSHPQPQHVHRSVVMSQVFEGTQLPLTLLRPGDEGYEQAYGQVSTATKPPWHSVRVGDCDSSCRCSSTEAAASTDLSMTRSSGGRKSPSHKGFGTTVAATVTAAAAGDGTGNSSLATPGVGCSSKGSKAGLGAAAGGLNPEDQAWEARLPRGLTVDKCVGLPQSASVLKLVEAIRDVDEFRRMQGSLLLPDSDLVSVNIALKSAAAAAHQSTAPDRSGATTSRLVNAELPLKTRSVSSAAAAAVGALGDDPAAAAAAAAAAQISSSSTHTELLESCGVAVLQLTVLPGQAAVAGAVLAGALDDVAASWAAVAHDEGLQLVRWSAKQWILLAQLEPGTSKRAGLEGLADALLSAAARLAGVVARSEGLPVLGLAAGLASGSCFVQYEAGNFVCSMSGRACEAATQLCAAAMPAVGTVAAATGGAVPACCSHTVLMVSDGAAALLQTNFRLEACGGGSLLLSAHAALPAAAEKSGFTAPPNRQTLGPGRHTILGSGPLAAMTPKTPGNQGFAVRKVSGKARNRRQSRRKFEALEELFSGAGDSLPPPPEHMLTQPPPPRVAPGSAAGDASGIRSVNFSGADASKPSSTGRTGGKGFKPNLKISVVVDSGTAAGSNPAVTPGAAGTCKTPKLGVQGYSSEVLTPTLIMDSPQWAGRGAAGHAGAADARETGWQPSRLPSTTPKPGRASMCAGRGSDGGARSGNATATTPGSASTPGSSGSGSGSRQSIRQQVWQEVQEMRGHEASCAGGLALGGAGSVVSPCRESSQQSSLSSSNRTPNSAGCGRSKLKLDLHAMPKTPPGAAAAAATGTTGDSSTTGRAAASGRVQFKVTFQSPRTSNKINSKAASSAAAATACTQPGRNSLLAQPQQHSASLRRQQQQQQQQQQLDSEASQQSVNSLSLWPDPKVTMFASGSSSSCNRSNLDGCTGCTAAGTSSGVLLLGTAAGRAAAAARQQQQRQHMLVMSACKALGSVAAAEGYVAALPEGLMTVNLSTAGLSRLPALTRLTQLETLSASFNHLSSLPHLAPADTAAVAAAAAAAADNGSSNGSRSASSNASGQSGTAADPAAAEGQNGRPAAAVDVGVMAAVTEKLSRQLVSAGISALPASLTCLGLAYNQLVEVHLCLPAALPRLTELDLSHNQLTELPSTFGALSCVKLVFLGHNLLTQLPASFTRLFSLQTLSLDHNQLAQLPQDIQQLNRLASLHLQQNQLQQLPAGLGCLTALKSLGLGYNKLQQLPDGMLAGLCSLSSLDLSGNGLTDEQLQAAVTQPVSLRQPELSAAASDPEVAAAEMAEAARATATVAAAGEAAAAVEQVVVAEAAAAAAAQPEAAAVEAAVLPELQLLDISHNQLRQLPAWLPQRLQHLSAAGNRIWELPGDMCGRLSSSLRVLDLQDNLLESVPTELQLLEHLQVLALGGNPGMDPEVLGKGSGMVWTYRWLSTQKLAAAATLRGTRQRQQQARPMQQQRQQQGSVLPDLPGIRQTIIAESGRIAGL